MSSILTALFCSILLATECHAWSGILVVGLSGVQTYSPYVEPHGAMANHINLPHTAGAAITKANGLVYFMGGWNGAFDSDILIFNPVNNQTITGPALPQKIDGMSATTLSDSTVLICGGIDEQANMQKKCWNLVNNEWKAWTDYPTTIKFSNMVMLKGQPTVFGGEISRAVYAFDSSSQAWVRQSTLPDGVEPLTIVALNETSVLLCGATTSINITASYCYIYSATDASWTISYSLPYKMVNGCLVKFSDRIWYIGGNYTDVLTFDAKLGWQHTSEKLAQVFTTGMAIAIE